MSKISTEEIEELEIATPSVPTAPELPDPPEVHYQRPVPKADPATQFLTRRGLGGRDAGNMGKAFGIGTGLVGSILGGVFLGWLADRYLIHQATPWGLIGGFLLGVTSGFVNLIKLSNDLNKN
jgi:hypothetical protein